MEIIIENRNYAIKFTEDCISTILQAKRKAIEGTGIKILAPKQMLKRFPIAVAQANAGTISENLLNETRQIVCSLY